MREDLKKRIFENKKVASFMDFENALEAKIMKMSIDDVLKEHLFKIGVESYVQAWEDMGGE